MANTTFHDQINPTASSDDVPPQFQSLSETHSEDEEEDLCRICRCGATSEDPLHYPCACRGSIKFVHQNCLLQWIKHRGSHHCEVCRHTFSFVPIYAEKAPSRLSIGEQISWVAGKAWTGLQFLARLALVIFVWFVIVPLGAAQIWDMIFIRNLRELGRFDWLRDSETVFYEIACGQAIVLCSLLVAAVSAMCLTLLGENRIPPMIGGPNNESFVEIVGMRGPAINLVKRALKGQLCIAFLLVIGVLVPFSWGRILYQMNTIRNGVHGHASDSMMLAVGYSSILGPGAIFVGLYFIRRFSKEISLSRDTIIKALSACRSFVLRLVRQGFIFMVVFGVLPCVCGWWLDICTMKLVKLQLGGLDLALVFPSLRILVMWARGILSLVVIRKFLLIICELQHMLDSLVKLALWSLSKTLIKYRLFHLGWVASIAMLVFILCSTSMIAPYYWQELQQGILDSLQIPRDINQNWIQELTDASWLENAYRVVIHTGVFMTLAVILTYLPFKVVMYAVPSFFPMNFILCYSPSGLHWNTLGRLLRSHYISRHYNPHSAFKFILHHWLSLAGRALGLDDFLLPMDGDADGNACICRVDAVKESQDDDGDSKLQLVLRIAVLLILGSASLSLLTSALIIVPISLGRAVFSLILWVTDFNVERNDEINFLVGCYIISDGIVAVRSFINFVGTRRILTVLQLAGKWCIIVLKSVALLSVSVLVIPLMIGLLANLMIEMPLDVSMDERPVFYFHHIWVVGCVTFSAWIRLVMSDVQDTTFVNWRIKFERVKADGFSRLRAFWVLREILFPIAFNLLTWLCIPYLFAKGVFPLLGCSIRANSTVYHFAWLGYLLLSVLWYIVKKLCIWLGSLHDRIKDDRYLIGQTLCNYGENGH